MKKIEGVILDWAGTTVDYGSCAPMGVFVEVFKRHGHTITTAQARGPMGMEKKAHIKAVCATVAGRSFTDREIEAMYRDFIPLQLECLPRYADLIPGTLEAVSEFRRRGIKIGTTTGYNSDMMAVLAKEAEKRGYKPDVIVSGSDTAAGRPHPWMALLVASRLQIYPMSHFVKIGDTVADIGEGLNAGMWTIALAKSGNELGLTEKEIATMEARELARRLQAARGRLHAAGAHYVVDSIADTPALIDEINGRLLRGEHPLR